MAIRIHSVEASADGTLRVIGDATDFDMLERIDLSRNGEVIASETKFNPNFCEPTPPTRPRLNHFVLDVSRDCAGGLQRGNAHLTAIGRDLRQSTDISSHLRNFAQESHSEPDFDKVLCDPSAVDQQIELTTSRQLTAVYPLINSLLDSGVLKKVPTEYRVKWLDLAVFSLLSPGANRPILAKLGSLLSAIESLARGSYAEASARASVEIVRGSLTAAVEIYEAADIRDYIQVSPWTSGMSGMTSIGTLIQFADSGAFFNMPLEFVGALPKNKLIALASADSTYFKQFGGVLLASARTNFSNVHVHYNVINPDQKDLEVMQEVQKNFGHLISFSISRYSLRRIGPDSQRGLFTLNRFIVLSRILELCGAPVMTTEADAVFTQQTETILREIEGHDLGFLALQRYVRPWMHTTAPLVYVSDTEVGRTFAQALLTSLRATMTRNTGRQLWGVDQSAIYSAVRYTDWRCPSLKAINLIPFANSLIYQAQLHPGGKEGFLSSHADSSWSSLIGGPGF